MWSAEVGKGVNVTCTWTIYIDTSHQFRAVNAIVIAWQVFQIKYAYYIYIYIYIYITVSSTVVTARTTCHNVKFLLLRTQRVPNSHEYRTALIFLNKINRLVLVTETMWGTQQRSSLRRFATSRKPMGSISDEVTGFVILPDPSSRTMALGST
jgi:hypothetical protein